MGSVPFGIVVIRSIVDDLGWIFNKWHGMECIRGNPRQLTLQHLCDEMIASNPCAKSIRL